MFSYGFLLDAWFESYVSVIFCCCLSFYAIDIKNHFDYFNNILMVASLILSTIFIPLMIYLVANFDKNPNKYKYEHLIGNLKEVGIRKYYMII